MVLGGGLFAAGVMVGRHSARPAPAKPDPLTRIDARDADSKLVKDSSLSFPKELSAPRPDKKSKPAPRPKPQPPKADKPDQAPKPSPRPAEGSAKGPHSLKVASGRRASAHAPQAK